MRTRSISRSAIALMAGVSVSMVALAKPPQGMPQAKFSWSMAERTRAVENLEFKPELYNGERHWMIEGPTPGQPGLYAGVSSVPLDEINPRRGFEVTFDGCASTGNIQQYEWRIDGKRAAKSKSCSYTTRLKQGRHHVELIVNGGGRKSRVSEKVKIRDILVVIMGDSYSSGEGNPTRYDGTTGDDKLEDALANNGAGWSEQAYWDYANCHRSTRAGQANAAIDLEQSDPHSSVTTIFLACSGAQIDSGINGVKNGYLSGPEKPQTLLAYELTLAKGRSIDAITLGIGGNDIGFVPIVAEGALQEDAFLSTELSVARVTIPSLPLVDTSPLLEDELARLVLPSSDAFPQAGVPGLPPNAVFRTLDSAALHACDSQFQKATFGDGGLGPDESCREAIGTTEVGLAQVHACLTGDTDNACQFARSYYDFDKGTWQYPTAAEVPGLDLPQSWPGLRVHPSRVFYTEYPDLTTVFGTGVEPFEFCDISIEKSNVIRLLWALLPFVDNPELIEALIAALNLSNVNTFGLAQNEFEWASRAVLNGFEDPMDRVLLTELTAQWKAPKEGFGQSWLLGPSKLGMPTDYPFIRYGKGGDLGPALNEMTLLSGIRYQWTPVIGTHDLASGHGLCADQPDGNNDAVAAYAYLIGGLPNTTNVSGSAHPNMLGKRVFREPLADALKAALEKHPGG